MSTSSTSVSRQSPSGPCQDGTQDSNDNRENADYEAHSGIKGDASSEEGWDGVICLELVSKAELRKGSRSDTHWLFVLRWRLSVTKIVRR
jgi:hypothetical protein